MRYTKGMKAKPQRTLKQIYPIFLVIVGIIGLLAAFILTQDKIQLLKNPDYSPSCNLNPVLSCGSIIGTDQASVFGFPNPVLGLVGFSVVITIGMGLLAGASYKKWFMKGLLAASALAFIFVHWLIYQSLYSIGALCIYCMIVWSVTWPILLYTFIYMFREKLIIPPASLRSITSFIQKHHVDILVTWYVVILILIIENFWYYWKTLI